MTAKLKRSLVESLNIIWVITSKDIVDALKNRVVVSMIVMLGIMLLVPKALPYIFEQSQTVVPIYNMADVSLMTDLKDITSLSIQEVRSEQELKLSLCSAFYPEIGLEIPADIRQVMAAGEQVVIQGFVCWGKRHQVADLQPRLEEALTQSLGEAAVIHLEGNFFFPPTEGVLSLSLTTVNSIVLILMIGIFMVPSLLIEEKETKTLQALLVSPASITQVVAGKALAGCFYILVSGILIFLISWIDVIHWDLVFLYIIGNGIFSVAVGLLLGSIFEKPQDMAGWMTTILLILIGTVLIKTFGIELPALITSVTNWIPSVALAIIYRAALSETYSALQIWTSFGSVLIVSLLLYIEVIIILRRSNR